MNTNIVMRRVAAPALLLAAGIMFAGCPPELLTYDQGFADGFAQDDYYWDGYFDSYDTVDAGPIYYDVSNIPVVLDPPYDAGYYDGLWYAYNDGYFVEYDYAFTIGWSEGYDMGYYPAWALFLAADEHPEFLDGGFSDGYNDGFTEGSVFGAYDWENDIAYDWLGAMLDYRSGIDVTIGGYSTGDLGPVELYVYGTDPYDLVKTGQPSRVKPDRAGLTVRYLGPEKAEIPDVSYRPLTAEAQTEFSITPTTSPRGNRNLTLTSSWLARVNEYRASLKK